jgi:hypothetical protein
LEPRPGADGGKQDITANCLVIGGTAVSNTAMQLNL